MKGRSEVAFPPSLENLDAGIRGFWGADSISKYVFAQKSPSVRVKIVRYMGRGKE
jgi:hypothetical protein